MSSEDDKQNAVLGRLVDGFSTLSASVGKIEILITERTAGLPSLVKQVNKQEIELTKIKTAHTTAKETHDRGLKNLKLILAVVGSVLTLGTAYAAIMHTLEQTVK